MDHAEKAKLSLSETLAGPFPLNTVIRAKLPSTRLSCALEIIKGNEFPQYELKKINSPLWSILLKLF